MHAVSVLQSCLGDALSSMHALRARVLLGAVAALCRGRRLVLMDLARSWPGAERVRAPLKRLDRLLGNPHLHAERTRLYAALIPWLIRQPRPLILIDWSPLKADGCWQLLRAAVPGPGRSLTLYEEIHPQRLHGAAWVEQRFLRRLHRLLPAAVQPIPAVVVAVLTAVLAVAAAVVVVAAVIVVVVVVADCVAVVVVAVLA